MADVNYGGCDRGVMGPGFGAGMVEGLIFWCVSIGVAVGLVFAGLVWFLIWLFSHVDMAWVA